MITDSFILLPALGCPAIAHPVYKKKIVVGYKFFVSMLIVFPYGTLPYGKWNHASADYKKKYLADEIAVEPFQTHVQTGNLPTFQTAAKIDPSMIEFPNAGNGTYKVNWLAKPNFLKQCRADFWKAYLKRTNAKDDPDAYAENATEAVEVVKRLVGA